MWIEVLKCTYYSVLLYYRLYHNNYVYQVKKEMLVLYISWKIISVKRETGIRGATEEVIQYL